jgi:hypothetical protein
MIEYSRCAHSTYIIQKRDNFSDVLDSGVCDDAAAVHARPNTGRDAGSALDYIVEHYDDLPDVVVFTPSTTYKHDRRARLLSLLECTDMCFSCANNEKHVRTSFRWDTTAPCLS